MRSTSQQPVARGERIRSTIYDTHLNSQMPRLNERHTSEIREISNLNFNRLRENCTEILNGTQQYRAPRLIKELSPPAPINVGNHFKLEARFEACQPPAKLKWIQNKKVGQSNVFVLVNLIKLCFKLIWIFLFLNKYLINNLNNKFVFI